MRARSGSGSNSTARRRRSLVRLFAALFVTVVPATSFALKYTLSFVETPGGANAEQTAIDSSGVVVGVTADGAAFLSAPGRAPITLGNFKPIAMNDRGAVVGVQGATAVVYKDGVLATLPLPAISGDRLDINDAGDVVGTYKLDAQRTHAFLYRDGLLVDLGLPTTASSHGVGATSNGQALGWIAPDVSGARAFLSGESGPRMFGPADVLPGATNDAGAFIAEKPAGQGVLRVASDGSVRDLGTLASRPHPRPVYQPRGVSNGGQAVGTVVLQTGNFTASTVAWVHNGAAMQEIAGMIANFDSAWTIEKVVGINDHGQIAVEVCQRMGQCRPAVLTPIRTEVIEYRNEEDFAASPGGHFFYTDDAAEIALLDAGTFGKFVRTGKTFPGGGPAQTCRFYGSVVPGPNSHFYTALDSECDHLKSLQVSPIPSDVPQWNYEGPAFAVYPASTAATATPCPRTTKPVYRAYNNAFPASGARNPWDSNHRFSSDHADIAHVVESFGWVDEGVAFCVSE